MTEDLTRITNILEAALLTAGEPVSLTQLSKLFDPPLESDVIRKLLDQLRATWNGRSVELAQVASGWRFQARPEVQPFLERLSPEKPPRYSRAVMETLAIVAYNQPVPRSRVEEVRGVNCESVLTNLELRDLITEVGRGSGPGQPKLYGTTMRFLQVLGLESLDHLPAPGSGA